MRSPGINGGELRGQPANPGSHGKMAVKMECECLRNGATNMFNSPKVSKFLPVEIHVTLPNVE